MGECVNEQECEQQKLGDASPGEGNQHGNAVVSEHVTSEEEDRGAAAWTSAVFRWLL